MATHDNKAGAGGVDGSIMFETDREENVGLAFANTLGFLVIPRAVQRQISSPSVSL